MKTDFSFIRVDDNEDLLYQTYRLRYKIYCEEKNFLDPKDYPDGIESDVFDNHSMHFAALTREGEVIGTMRVILHSDLGFPIEEHCTVLSDDWNNVPKDKCVEVSRFAVCKSYQRGKDKTIVESGTIRDKLVANIDSLLQPVAVEKCHQSMITFGLIRAAYQEAKRLGITHWYAAMEKRLWYGLNKFFAFLFHAAGPQIDFYGPVTPYIAVVADLERNIYEKKPHVMHDLLTGLERRYRPKIDELLTEGELKTGAFFDLQQLLSAPLNTHYLQVSRSTYATANLATTCE